MGVELILIVPIAFFIIGMCLPVIRAILKIFKCTFRGMEFVFKGIAQVCENLSRGLQPQKKKIPTVTPIRPNFEKKMVSENHPNPNVVPKIEEAPKVEEMPYTKPVQRNFQEPKEKQSIKGSPTCLNDKDKGVDQLSSLGVLIEKVKNPTKKALLIEEYNQMDGKIMSGKAVIDAICKLTKPVKYLYDITIEHNGEKYQFDNIVVTNEGIYVIDSSSILSETYVDENGSFFSVKTDGTKEPMVSPVSKQNLKARALNDILKAGSIDCTLPIYSGVVLSSKNAKLSVGSNRVVGLYPDYVKFIKNIKCTAEPTTLVNRIGYYLTEFNQSYKVDYFEKYDLGSEDFIPIRNW
jgi:Nuclease-related domain.